MRPGELKEKHPERRALDLVVRRLGSAGTAVVLLAVGSVGWTAPASAGVNRWTTNGPGGGVTQALAVDPGMPTTLYAGTSGGGVFKSTDGGGSWSATSTGLTSTDVRALAIDPVTPTTLYAGTSSGGVFKSTNGGGGWSAVNTDLTSPLVEAVALDPGTPTTLYAGTSGGVFKSTDGGGSWMAVNTGLLNLAVHALAIDPATPSTIYAGTGHGPVLLPNAGVYKSVDSGANWTRVSPEEPVVSLAIDPTSPTTVYAGTTQAPRFAVGVLKTTDGGASWNLVNTGLTDFAVYGLAIDPATPNIVYAGTIPSGLSGEGGVFRSANGGALWSPLNVGLTSRDVRALALDPKTTPHTVYAGTGGGVFALQQGSVIQLGVRLNRSSFRPGDPLTVELSVSNPGVETVVDIFFGVVLPPHVGLFVGCPAGDGVGFLTGSGFTLTCLSAPPQSFPRLAQGVPVPAGLPPVTRSDFLAGVVQPGTPAGNYVFFLAFIRSGALATAAVGSGDLMLATRGFAVIP